MGIPKARATGTRNLIGWFAKLPEKQVMDTFKRWGFLVQVYTEADLQVPAKLFALSAMVFVQSPEKPNRVVRLLDSYWQALLSHGSQVIVLVAATHPTADGKFASFAAPLANLLKRQQFPAAGLSVFKDDEIGIPREARSGEPSPPHVRFFTLGTSWDWVAKSIAATSQEVTPSTPLEIFCSGLHLDETHRALLRRAFFDCATVHLAPMDEEGKSGALVFRAYADMAEGLLGRWPQPYFVKIATRNKIYTEYQNYIEVVDPYVPFHLGPHLIPERCHLGAKLGIIAGDFVERAESLRECANRGRAAPMIAALFHTTLHGWYRSASEKDIPLPDCLKFPDLDRIPKRLRHARRMGAKMDVAVLNAMFQSSASLLPVLIGPIHGDLHASNILIRSHDAIVIDFCAHRDEMPILYDVACLEASLLLDGFASDDRKVLPWLESVAPLYQARLLETACATVHPKDNSAWFFSCVTQIRLFARDMQRRPGQYAATLALALLRKASKDPSLKGKQSIRRAAACVLAERLLNGAFGESGALSAESGARRELDRRPTGESATA